MSVYVSLKKRYQQHTTEILQDSLALRSELSFRHFRTNAEITGHFRPTLCWTWIGSCKV